MFEELTYLQLQQYWWIIISLLGGLFVFMMFVQGGQMLFEKLSNKDEELKTLMINSLGRKWELGFTTLVLFGGALFASFPLFYSTSFGGAYWVWILILFCFILQAVSYEYRKKPNNFLGQKTFEFFLFLNGSLGVFVLGVAIATFFSGSQFLIDDNNFSYWQNSFRGLESLVSIFNLCLGCVLVFLSRILGAMYFINNINNGIIYERAKAEIKKDFFIFLFFFAAFIGMLFMREGFSYNGEMIIIMEKYKYFNNFIDMPIVLGMFLIGVLLLLFAVYMTLYRNKRKCIILSGLGTVLVVMSLLLNVGLNNTSFYPSVYDLQSSLTIQNSSSSEYTLTVMSYVSLLVPIVLGYIIYIWHKIDKDKLTLEEIEKSSFHAY